MKLRKEEEEEEKGEKEQEQEEEEEGRREGGGKTPGSRKKQSELCMCGGEREHPVTETLSALKTKRKEQGLGPRICGCEIHRLGGRGVGSEKEVQEVSRESCSPFNICQGDIL